METRGKIKKKKQQQQQQKQNGRYCSDTFYICLQMF